jgi:hypothetical protein
MSWQTNGTISFTSPIRATVNFEPSRSTLKSKRLWSIAQFFLFARQIANLSNELSNTSVSHNAPYYLDFSKKEKTNNNSDDLVAEIDFTPTSVCTLFYFFLLFYCVRAALWQVNDCRVSSRNKAWQMSQVKKSTPKTALFRRCAFVIMHYLYWDERKKYRMSFSTINFS